MGEIIPEKPVKLSVFKHFWAGFSNYFWDMVGVKSAGDAMTEHALTVERKGRFLAVATIFLIVAGSTGWFLKGCHSESDRATQNYLIQSNQLLVLSYQSQLLGLNRKISDSESEIAGLKTDLNEVKREKDAEIVTLTAERNSAQEQVRILQALPSNASAMYSNIMAMGGSIDRGRPSFDLMLNGIPVTNRTILNNLPVPFPSAIVPLQESRAIFLQAAIHSDAAVDRLTIDFQAPLAGSNVIADSRWTGPVPGLNVNSKEFNKWKIVAADPALNGFDATAFKLSTNVSEPAIPAYVDVYAVGCRLQRFMVFLVLTK